MGYRYSQLLLQLAAALTQLLHATHSQCLKSAVDTDLLRPLEGGAGAPEGLADSWLSLKQGLRTSAVQATGP
jgi:hypothetical protein